MNAMDTEIELRDYYSSLLSVDEVEAANLMAAAIAQERSRRVPRHTPLPRALLAAASLVLVAAVGLLGVFIFSGQSQPSSIAFTAGPVMPTASPSPSASPSPVVSCGNLTAADCLGAEGAAIKAVAAQTGSRGQVVSVELGSGLYCQEPGHLFDAAACAEPLPSGGGSWIGHALLSFSDTASQGYLNIARSGTTYLAVLLAVASPPPSS
jgi:hypothetical protein